MIFLILFLAYGYFAQDIQLDFWAQEEWFNARTFPVMIAAGGSLLALLYVTLPPAFESPDLSGFSIEVFALIALMFLYAGCLEPLGFVIATSLFLGAGFVILGERKVLRIGMAAIGLTGGVYLLMTLLGIHLPPGVEEGLLEGLL